MGFVTSLSVILPLLQAVAAGGPGGTMQAGGRYAGSDACKDCHAEQSAQFAATAMGRAMLDHPKTDLDRRGCEACHGPGADHAASGGENKIGMVSFSPKSTNSVNERNTTCLQCHDSGSQANFESGMHSRRNVACASCHSAHTPKSVTAQLKTTTETETCFSCHKTARAQSLRTSHHPVREGKVNCSSCHNPHEGNRPKMIKAESVNDLCYGCHTEKRGPFLFQHAPVVEDCVSCHTPHGSNHNRMLVQKMPNLCWNCHLTGSGHFGSGDNYSTEKGVPVAPPGAPSGYPTVNSRFIGRSCLKCHVNIHGSNSPSGAFFLR